MKAICALYEEWLEVMEDYATVFDAEGDSQIPQQVIESDPSHVVPLCLSFLICVNIFL
jgi:hypothetical protein